ncbi:hypothetical protein JQN58_01145 [Aneurinibacillus sp. BA2021]|nr:hypothetical protein [Aneurinibacillus sp. BA2021]
MKEETRTIIQQIAKRYQAVHEQLECQIPETANTRLALLLTRQQIERLHALFSAKNN